MIAFQNIAYVLRPEWSDTIAPLCALQALLFVAFIGVRRSATPVRDAVRGASVLALFLPPSLIPQMAAWASPWTAIDLFVYVLCGCEIGMWLVVSYAFHVVPPMIRPFRHANPQCD